MKKGRMQGIFLPVKKLFKTDQYVFELTLGSDNVLAIFERTILASKFQLNYPIYSEEN